MPTQNILRHAVSNYSNRLRNLTSDKGEAGQLFEDLIFDIIQTIPTLKVLHNDYLTANIGGVEINNLQVDCHVRRKINNKLLCCIEAKTYVDACFMKRAVSDFMSISRSVEHRKNLRFVVFAGQRNVKKETESYQQAFLKEFTGKGFELFVVNLQKTRNSTKPLYQEQLPLDLEELNRFRNYLLKL